ncbi:hypothetical protein PIB30_085500 [Stylosanthes scabra]|uniref:Putative plant transposon protein domain-containing protein n=1 Tax=Stylosanthes scabra TaxID=79078 RepID=A0ABU6UT16_9FABA|nr:hypothetical protein [Stylosanthes scabra]
MSSSSDSHDAHCFRSQFHQDLFEEHVASKSVTPEKSFDLQEDQYPDIQEQIANRGWRRLSKPRTKISKVLIQEFYANVMRVHLRIGIRMYALALKEKTSPDLLTAFSSSLTPQSFNPRGIDTHFTVGLLDTIRYTCRDLGFIKPASQCKKIKQVLRIRDNTPGAQTTFDTRQKDDQRLNEVIREICVPGARWKMSSSQPNQPIQLKRQDLTPLARGWAEFIIHSIIPTGNKSEDTVARAVLIHSIIKGDDVRVEELIADNIAITAEGVHGRSQLIFPSTIYRVMVRTRGRNINYQQHEEEEEDQPEPMQQDENEAEHVYEDDNQEEQQDMHVEAPNADFQNTFQE